MKILITEFMDETALNDFGNDVKIIYRPDLADKRITLLEMVSDIDALIVRNRTKVDQELLNKAPNLRVVGRLGVGLDNIDTTACNDKKVEICPATGANAVAVAEYIIATSLVLVRGAYYANDAMIGGTWPRKQLIGGELYGRIMGLYGFGDIARKVALRAQALGMQIIAHDPYVSLDDPAWQNVENVSKEDLLARSDILSLHVPATSETHHAINASTLAMMKSSAILINTARGTIIDVDVVVDALNKNHLAGAALDVFPKEPVDQEAGTSFKDVPNLILTPHIAGVTHEANMRVSALVVEKVKAKLGIS